MANRITTKYYKTISKLIRNKANKQRKAMWPMCCRVQSYGCFARIYRMVDLMRRMANMFVSSVSNAPEHTLRWMSWTVDGWWLVSLLCLPYLASILVRWLAYVGDDHSLPKSLFDRAIKSNQQQLVLNCGAVTEVTDQGYLPIIPSAFVGKPWSILEYTMYGHHQQIVAFIVVKLFGNHLKVSSVRTL